MVRHQNFSYNNKTGAKAKGRRLQRNLPQNYYKRREGAPLKFKPVIGETSERLHSCFSRSRQDKRRSPTIQYVGANKPLNSEAEAVSAYLGASRQEQLMQQYLGEQQQRGGTLKNANPQDSSTRTVKSFQVNKPKYKVAPIERTAAKPLAAMSLSAVTQKKLPPQLTLLPNMSSSPLAVSKFHASDGGSSRGNNTDGTHGKLKGPKRRRDHVGLTFDCLNRVCTRAHGLLSNAQVPGAISKKEEAVQEGSSPRSTAVAAVLCEDDSSSPVRL